ncbi:MAG: thiamine phosphate synthase [Gemmatimonadales bacterium]
MNITMPPHRRPLPRLHAVTDADVLTAADFGIRAAAIAAAGSAVALHARDRSAGGAVLGRAAARLLALARPAEAAVFVSARPDVAAAVGAQGVQLAAGDLAPADARRILPAGWIGRSVHSEAEAHAAVTEGADYLFVGNVYATTSHPGRPAAGLGLVRAAAALGRPVIAIGGVDAARAVELRDAGAWGVAAITALWAAPDPAAAALALLAPWADDT